MCRIWRGNWRRWLDEARTQSTLDWIRGRFVLVANGHFEYWRSACKLVELQTGLVIHLVACGGHEQWMTLTQTSPIDALLIRPDDFVAARLNTLEPVGQLLEICGAF